MPARITLADVDRMAALARLELTPRERDQFATELAAILDYAAQVLEIDTTDVPPMSHPDVAAAPLRDDALAPSLGREDALHASAGADDTTGLFKVPRVIGP